METLLTKDYKSPSAVKFLLIMVLLLVGYFPTLVHSKDQDSKDYHLDIWTVPGGKYQPCCMDIIMVGDRAKHLFDKMPDSTIVSTKGTCAEGKIMKVSNGVICFANHSTIPGQQLKKVVSYDCSMSLEYETGILKNVETKGYLQCDEQ